jgi:hypothetical protein
MGLIPPWLQARGFKFRELDGQPRPVWPPITNESALNYYSDLTQQAKEERVPVIKTKSLNVIG